MRYKTIIFLAIALWLIATCACILTACTTTHYVTVPEQHSVYSHSSDTVMQRDSIFMHDSIIVTHWGDTVRIVENHIVYRDRWRDRLRVDSFIQRDTLTIVKEVEKPPSRWQKTKMQLGSTLLWMLFASVAFLAIRIIIKRYKRG